MTVRVDLDFTPEGVPRITRTTVADADREYVDRWVRAAGARPVAGAPYIPPPVQVEAEGAAPPGRDIALAVACALLVIALASLVAGDRR